MDIGKIIEIIEDEPELIPVEIPQKREKDEPIPVENWPVREPVEVER